MLEESSFTVFFRILNVYLLLASQVMLAAALGCEELGIANKLLAQSIFGLWMTSSLLGERE